MARIGSDKEDTLEHLNTLSVANRKEAKRFSFLTSEAKSGFAYWDAVRAIGPYFHLMRMMLHKRLAR